MAKSCGATQPGADRFSYPLVVLMVAYTMTSLWILALPMVG